MVIEVYQFLECNPLSLRHIQNSPYEVSLAKSHAAKVTHARNRAKSGATTSPLLPEPARSINVSSLKEGSGRLVSTSSSRPTTPAVEIKPEERSSFSENKLPNPSETQRFLTTGALDPFFRLGCALTAREKSLLHSYFTSVPLRYGTGSQSAYCPVREITVRSVADSPIWLSWVLLQEDVGVIARRRSSSTLVDVDLAGQDTAILLRRARAYRLVKQTVADGHTALLDETVVGIFAAGVIEWRLGNWDESQKHLRATWPLLSMRRGGSDGEGLRAIQDIKYPAGMVALLGVVEVGCMAHLEGGDGAQRLCIALEATIDRLRTMQSWNLAMQETEEEEERNGLPSMAVDRHDSLGPSLSSTSNRGKRRRSERCRTTRTRCLSRSSSSSMHAHLDSALLADRPSDLRPYLAVLFAINTILWSLRDDEAEDLACRFLEDLAYTISMSAPLLPGDRNKATTACSAPGAALSSMSVFFMIAHCAVKLGGWRPSDGSFLRIWEVVEFVDIMMLASPELRLKVVNSLSSWLLTEPPKGGYGSDNNGTPRRLVLLTEADLGSITRKIAENGRLMGFCSK